VPLALPGRLFARASTVLAFWFPFGCGGDAPSETPFGGRGGPASGGHASVVGTEASAEERPGIAVPSATRVDAARALRRDGLIVGGLVRMVENLGSNVSLALELSANETGCLDSSALVGSSGRH
jgi:hypothetical protein